MEYTKTVVAELHGKYAIVLDQGGQLQKIKRKQGMKVGDLIYYTPEDIYHESNNVISFKPSRLLTPLVVLAAILFLFVAYQNFMPGQDGPQVSAAVSIGTEQGIQLEFDQNNIVSKVRDANGLEISDSTLVGVSLDDLMPIISSQIISTNQEDIVIASTIQDPEFKNKLVQSIREQSGTNNIVFLDSSLEEYQASLNNHVPFTEYALEENNIQLWDNQEGQQLSVQEKQEILGNSATYYQIGPNFIELRQQLQEYINQLKDSMQKVILPPRHSIEEVDEPALPIMDDDDDWDDDDDDWDDYDDDDWDDYDDDDWDDYDDEEWEYDDD